MINNLSVTDHLNNKSKNINHKNVNCVCGCFQDREVNLISGDQTAEGCKNEPHLLMTTVLKRLRGFNQLHLLSPHYPYERGLRTNISFIINIIIILFIITHINGYLSTLIGVCVCAASLS